MLQGGADFLDLGEMLMLSDRKLVPINLSISTITKLVMGFQGAGRHLYPEVFTWQKYPQVLPVC